MRRGFGARWTWTALALLGLGWTAAPAAALEYFDERLQIHGFAETRMSFGWEDFDSGNQIDMYSWLQVLNIEAEAEIAPDGWGPFDMVAAFARVEVKYDCVWTHACGMIQNVDTFGNDPGTLPDRVQNGERLGIAGSQYTSDTRPWYFDDRTRLDGRFEDEVAGQRDANSMVYGSTNAQLFAASSGPDTINSLAAPGGTAPGFTATDFDRLGTFNDIRFESGPNARAYGQSFTDPTTRRPGDDEAGLYLFDRTSNCEVGNNASKSSNLRGFSNRELIWGIDNCDIQPLGFNREVANPFADAAVQKPYEFLKASDWNPVLAAIDLDPGNPATGGNANFGNPIDSDGIPDATALPFRPGTEFAALPQNVIDYANGQQKWHSQGIYVPNLAVRQAIRDGKFDTYDQNFTLNELSWNRGASQQTWKELRELYFEFEMFESRLWMRAGKQTIVWGKTELFRNQDQWNPVDIAIGPLASLEEARIALWALRGIWSFYEVGPLEDVRLELVGMFDKFEPTDVGRCGEPFVPRLACAKSYGLWVHGENGTGVAGEIRPEDPWNDTEGIEAGARVEFRWDRFSFALTDYWGYNDFPYQSLLFQYSRNVDPQTGRPRHTQATGPCTTGDFDTERDCLEPGMDPDPNDPTDNGVIANHSINQSLFAWICAGTVGVASAVDGSACAFTLFNSSNNPLGAPFAGVFSSIVGGTNAGAFRLNVLLDELAVTGGSPKIQPVLAAQFGPAGTNTLYPYPPASAAASPLVPLVYDGLSDGTAPTLVTSSRFATFTTEQQAALWGCGDFYFVNCDGNAAHPGPDGLAGTADDTLVGGFDLANGEASVMLQSFPWFEGTFDPNWDTTNPNLPQPGTMDAVLQGYGADVPDDYAIWKNIQPGGAGTGAVGTRFENGQLYILPGARYDGVVLDALATAAGLTLSPYLQLHVDSYDQTVDGSVRCGGVDPGTAANQGCREIVLGSGIFAKQHPFTGQIWASEMAIASFNFVMLASALGALDSDEDAVPGSGDEVVVPRSTLDRSNPFALGRCSLAQPQYCAFVSGLAAQARLTNSRALAGGNGTFGRRNFVWASVGDLALRYEKRNILGFSMDFAEDTTKSSWGVEFTHVNDALNQTSLAYSGLRELDEYNLTISVDRPTFINFLNANRTFFINSQLFTSYLQGYEQGVLRDGPFTFLWLINANTGYFQDRFLVSTAMVYDFKSNSSAFLPSVQYRFTENFSLTIGGAVLAGHWERRELGINQFSAQSDNTLTDTIFVENGISPARDLDNFFFRIRYTY